MHPIDKLVNYSLTSSLPLFLFLFAVISGAIALNFTPREEEPQIVVPMIDVWVEVPNLSARQVERQATIPLEKLLTQIPGVEHVYSSSMDGRLSVTLSFYVGENREDALLNTYNKLYSNEDVIPSVVANWMLKPIEVDDVPILVLGLYSTEPSLYTDFELRRFAQEVSTLLQGIEYTSEVKVVGGRARHIQILMDPQALAARQTSVLDVYNAIGASNELLKTSQLIVERKSVLIETGDVIRSLDEMENLVVNVVNGKAVLLRDVAKIKDGPQEVKAYQWLEFAANGESSAVAHTQHPMVTVSVAKQKGSNAVTVVDAIFHKLSELKTTLLPHEVKLEVLRDYGETADEKVSNLISSLGFAIFTVVVFIGIFLGWRSAIVVGLAVPVCYGITLLLDLAFGYTINRVTLFALILSLGLLVDDPITGIDNISRFLRRSKGDKNSSIVAAMSEIRPALIMSTITIMLAFIPLAFITGMMGPYMAPMAFNVPISVLVSTLVAFLITPWLASRILKPMAQQDSEKEHIYHRWLAPLIASKTRVKVGLWLVLVMFIAAASLPVIRSVPLKLLPFDNKNEIQVLIDMPESATLEQSAAMAKQVLSITKQLPEVKTVAAYVGEPSPIDFNGMVRQYYRRAMPNLAELRVILIDKTLREHQSHAVVLRLRKLLKPLQSDNIVIKIVEVPPGPPVLSTLVAEIYAEPFIDHLTHMQAAQTVIKRLKQEPHVVEVDSSISAEQEVRRFIVDKQKAALSGISTTDVNQSIRLGVSGLMAGTYQQENEASPVPIELKLPFAQGNKPSDLYALEVKGRFGVAQQDAGFGLVPAPQPLVSLAELGKWQSLKASQAIMHKDLKPVIYVTAELSGRTPAEVIADISSDRGLEEKQNGSVKSNDWQSRSYLSSGGGISWQLPKGTDITFSGEGEWQITLDVFRDMGIAFAFALVGIFFVLRFQTSSTALSLIIMSAIPLTIIGIMPGFWLMNQFGERVIGDAPDPVLFTATAMIGMIALAGIVVRNSLILVEFITLARSEGMKIREALLQAGAVRMRPVLLTAGTTLLGNLIITLDPVFSGLALAIIFGIVASTAFSLFVVPMVYFLVFSDAPSEPRSAPLQTLSNEGKL
ncbi:MAG: multidrug efflux pump subunit AcrB [Parasphingorhabdus sp.]|jgi:multidrug efflux pump subunit AcrB